MVNFIVVRCHRTTLNLGIIIIKIYELIAIAWKISIHSKDTVQWERLLELAPNKTTRFQKNTLSGNPK